MLHDMLSKLATEYSFARAKPFANSELGNFVRHDLVVEARKGLIFLPFDLNIKGSVGAGNWASVPWLGYFDPLITTSATKGFYVVYLINPITEEIILSLNQGTTAVYQEFGAQRGREVLKRRATDIADRIPKFAAQFDTSEIDLSSSEALPKGYCAGHAFGRRYKAFSIDEGKFQTDLQNMLSAYETLIDRGGTTPSEVMQDESGSEDIEETRRYVLSRRIERAPNVRAKVLKARLPICEACGLNPEVHYNYQGPTKNTPLDVHHSQPISQLAEGESRRYKVPDDFRVLCPTCHRLIHKQANTSDIDQLKNSIRFQITPKR